MFDAVAEWLAARAVDSAGPTTAEPPAAPATPAAASEALLLLARLTVARGTLADVARLAKAVGRAPSAVAALSDLLVAQIQTLSCIDGFELSARASFGPVPGSTGELLARWEASTLPAVCREVRRRQSEVAASEMSDQLRDALRRGDTSAARTLACAALPGPAFAVADIPALEYLAGGSDALAYNEAAAQVRALDRLDAGAEDVGVAAMACLLGHVDLASRRLISNGGPRQPVGVDTAVLGSLGQLLSSNCPPDVLSRSDAHTARQVSGGGRQLSERGIFVS